MAVPRPAAPRYRTGTDKSDRTGTGTAACSAGRCADLREGFPLVTAEAAPALDHPRAAVVPEGRDQHRVPAGQQGHHLGRVGRRTRRLGPVYGKQWRRWTAGDGSRSTRSAGWSRDPPQPRLAPARGQRLERGRPAGDGADAVPHHVQFYVAGGRWAASSTSAAATSSSGCRSTSPATLLTHMVAQVTGLGVGDFVHTLGDAHLYSNHRQAREQLARAAAARRLNRRCATSSDSASRTSRSPAEPHPAIRAPVACERMPRITLIIDPRPGDRQGQCAALAPARRPETVQGADPGQAGADGAQDGRIDRSRAARTPEPGADPQRPHAGARHAGGGLAGRGARRGPGAGCIRTVRDRRRRGLRAGAAAGMLHATLVDTHVEGPMRSSPIRRGVA